MSSPTGRRGGHPDPGRAILPPMPPTDPTPVPLPPSVDPSDSPREPPLAPLPALREARVLARLLDNLVRVPGTRFRIGLDPMLGLVPGVGDWVGWLVGAHLLIGGARLRVPLPTLLRMAGNILIDALVGVVPLLGDLFDAAWKANARNLALLERHARDPDGTRRSSVRAIALVLGGTFALLGATGVGAVLLLRWLIGLI